MNNLNKVRQDYVAMYGDPAPCSFFFGRKFPAGNFLGVKEDNGIEVCFDFVSLNDDTFHILEGQFRNRLSRKFSYSVSETSFSMKFASFAEEEQEEVKRTISDLERFFSGKPISRRLKAEIALHQKRLNWRDESLVQAEMRRY